MWIEGSGPRGSLRPWILDTYCLAIWILTRLDSRVLSGLGVHDRPADRGAGTEGGGAGRQAGDLAHRTDGLLHPTGRHRGAARRPGSHSPCPHCKVSDLLIPCSNVGDPDPQDPHVFGPPGSGSFPFLIDVLSGLKYCLQNRILTQNFCKKLNFLDWRWCACWQVIRKKYEEKNFFCILTVKSMKKEVGSKVRSGSILVRCMDPGIRIRTKMSRIPNTASVLWRDACCLLGGHTLDSTW